MSAPDRDTAPSRGSMKPGPSEDYRALLRGEITPAEYVRRLKLAVNERMLADRRRAQRRRRAR